MRSLYSLHSHSTMPAYARKEMLLTCVVEFRTTRKVKLFVVAFYRLGRGRISPFFKAIRDDLPPSRSA